jgi:hypothetical protein
MIQELDNTFQCNQWYIHLHDLDAAVELNSRGRRQATYLNFRILITSLDMVTNFNEIADEFTRTRTGRFGHCICLLFRAGQNRAILNSDIITLQTKL